MTVAGAGALAYEGFLDKLLSFLVLALEQLFECLVVDAELGVFQLGGQLLRLLPVALLVALVILAALRCCGPLF